MKDLKNFLKGAAILLISAGCSGIDNPPEEPEQPEPVIKPDIENIKDGTGITFRWTDEGYGIELTSGEKSYTPYEDAPVKLEVFSRTSSSSSFYNAKYSEIEKDGEDHVCMAEVTTSGNAVFEVEDRYRVGKEEIRLNRTITVRNESASEFGFNSYFMIESTEDGYVRDYEYLIPSVLYRNGDNLNASFIGAGMTDDWILAREDRMGLPFVMMRNSSSGNYASIADLNREYKTIDEDFGTQHLCNKDFHFGSLGFFCRTGRPVLTYCHPGSEGEHTYSDGGSSSSKRWARRSHPVSTSTEHGYELMISLSTGKDFADALKESWKAVFDEFDPEVSEIRNEDVLDAGLETLSRYWMEDNGAPGFPFSIHLPQGDVHEISYDMGFVGMQIPCAYYLYRTGLETGNDDYIEKGEAILDFWAENSAAANGMPRVWWDISPWNLFRNYNDLRTMQGGMEGMILAWMTAERHRPGTKDQWLRYCTNAADWMISVQHDDGSWDMAYDNNGNSVNNGKLLTSNLIRFMTYMYSASGDSKYKEAALKAGEFCYGQIHATYRYVGSVIDNPYVMDRESGQKAIEAFLSLYDLTESEKWLDAAVQAAYYTVTYMYAWDIRQPEGNSRMAWDDSRNTTGITIISTGHSGADAGFSYNSYEYFRLYMLTGDEHLLKIARLLEKNTKQTMDLDGKLGYAYRGLQTEALRVVTHWGDNVNLWLPWLTAAALDPLYKMRDDFGVWEIDEALNQQ